MTSQFNHVLALNSVPNNSAAPAVTTTVPEDEPDGTVKSQVTKIFQKLDYRDRTEAVIKAVQRGIISLETRWGKR